MAANAPVARNNSVKGQSVGAFEPELRLDVSYIIDPNGPNKPCQ